MRYNKYRIVKYGKNLWNIIEPTRQLLLTDKENNTILKFESKEQALSYCKENNLIFEMKKITYLK